MAIGFFKRLFICLLSELSLFFAVAAFFSWMSLGRVEVAICPSADVVYEAQLCRRKGFR